MVRGHRHHHGEEEEEDLRYDLRCGVITVIFEHGGEHEWSHILPSFLRLIILLLHDPMVCEHVAADAVEEDEDLEEKVVPGERNERMLKPVQAQCEVKHRDWVHTLVFSCLAWITCCSSKMEDDGKEYFFFRAKLDQIEWKLVSARPGQSSQSVTGKHNGNQVNLALSRLFREQVFVFLQNGPEETLS